VTLVRRNERGRRWTTLGWSGAAALMGGFLLTVDPFGSIPFWLEEFGLLTMGGAGGALSLSLGAHGLGALRALPERIQRRRTLAAERRAARDDPALRESTRDLDRARLLRAGTLACFVLLYLLITGNLGTVDVGHHDLRGLEGMPTTGLLAALTAIGALAIVAAPVALLGRALLRLLGRGPELEPLDATGLVDEDWDLATLDIEPEPTAPPAAHPPPRPADVWPRSGWE
jgi:hypothetical protein